MQIRNIGFFHFGTRHNEPIEALCAALTAARGQKAVEDSLIVLPEGFNLAKKYREKSPPPNFDRKVIEDLWKLAERFEVTFVAGLIVKRGITVRKPYNSSYLIDGNRRSKILCRKQLDDGSGNYTPCRCRADIENPVCIEGIRVGSLICMDAWNTETKKRQTDLQNKRADVVCVPANYYQVMDNHKLDEALAQQWPGSFVVFANSYPNKMPSFILDRRGNKIRCANGSENKIVVQPFDAARGAGRQPC